MVIRWIGAGNAIVVLSLLLMTATRVRATAQEPDVIVIDGKQYGLDVNPLEEYLSQHPEKRPSANIVSTANWRGYIAYYAVVGTTLTLTDVRMVTDMRGAERSALAEIFPEAGPVPVKWFTGYLIIPDGKIRRYVHMGYGSEYARYIVIRVEDGMVAKRDHLSQKEFAKFRRAQFEAFKRTKEFSEAASEAMKGDSGMDPKQVEQFLYDYMSAVYIARVFR